MQTGTAAIDRTVLESFANQLADLAVSPSLKYFRHSLDIERKADASPVTIADRQIETILRDAIGARFPDHGIFGEEHGAETYPANTSGLLTRLMAPRASFRECRHSAL